MEALEDKDDSAHSLKQSMRHVLHVCDAFLTNK